MVFTSNAATWVVARRHPSRMSGQIKSGGLSAPMQAEPLKKTRKGSSEGDVRTPPFRSDNLLTGIREGKFPVGTFLPGELELIDHFKASRHTIREASGCWRIWAG